MRMYLLPPALVVVVREKGLTVGTSELMDGTFHQRMRGGETMDPSCHSFPDFVTRPSDSAPNHLLPPSSQSLPLVIPAHDRHVRQDRESGARDREAPIRGYEMMML